MKIKGHFKDETRTTKINQPSEKVPFKIENEKNGPPKNAP